MLMTWVDEMVWSAENRILWVKAIPRLAGQVWGVIKKTKPSFR